MTAIVLPEGYNPSRPIGQYLSFPGGYSIDGMQTVQETRRARLMLLIQQHGSLAAQTPTAMEAKHQKAKNDIAPPDVGPIVAPSHPGAQISTRPAEL